MSVKKRLTVQEKPAVRTDSCGFQYGNFLANVVDVILCLILFAILILFNDW